jgi:predicted DNA-binding transcriptional regulator YafY
MGKKLNPDATRSDKLLMLYRLLLLNDRKYTTSELTQKIDCSKQTIRAIVDTLNSHPDIVISEEYDEKTRCKKYFIEHNKHGMTEPIALEGFRQMELCRDLIGDVLPAEDKEKLNLAIFNAANYLPRKDRVNFKNLSIASSITKGFINYTPYSKQLHDLFYCMNNNKCCVLEYQKHIGEEVKEIYTAPVHLVLMRDCFYIYAWMLDRNNLQNNLYEAPTKYSVHRIKAVRIIEDSSSKHLPAGNSDKGYFGFIDDEEVYEVTLKFSDPYSITYVADRIWSTDQEITFNKDGTMLLKFKSTSYYEVMSFINSFGDQVEVIAPDTFREDVKSVIKKLVKLYGLDKE